MEFPSQEIKDYSENLSSPESPVLAELNRLTHEKVPFPNMLSGHLQGRILAFLSKMIRPQRILEVGTFTGYSAICLAEGLTADGKLITLEVDPGLKALATGFFAKAGIAHQCEMIIGEAVSLIPGLNEIFDLAFIDADKENYIRYYQLILPRLRPGGIILADNVLWSGKVLNPDSTDPETRALRDFAHHVAADPAVEQILLPVRDGIMVIRKL